MDKETLPSQRFGLGPIDQISFAVFDLDEALPRYMAMFGGPFTVIDVPSLDVVCSGRPISAALRLGFGHTGDIEVELVEVVAGDWPTCQWLEEHGEGLHHVRYPVDDVRISRAQMEAEGFRLTMLDGSGQEGFAYLESPLLNGMTIELIKRAN